MWVLKGCPKCHGDIFMEKDTAGWYEKCLQCGYNRDMEVMVEVKEQAPVPEEEASSRLKKAKSAKKVKVAAR